MKWNDSFNEECWFVFGKNLFGLYIGILHYHSKGTFCRVDFDCEEALSSKKLLGFYHTHPGGHPSPSLIDDETMRSWVKSEGKPMLCGIKSGDIQRCYLYYRSKLDRKIYKRHIFSFLNNNQFIGWCNNSSKARAA